MFKHFYGQLLFKSFLKSTILIASRRSLETHYDVLKLRPNCTSKDIRDAFIKLSKEHHPDINRNQASHDRFQRINEAYNVLNKPASRRLYDLGLSTTITNDGSTNRNHQQHHTDPTFWVNRDKSKDYQYKNRPYYGIDGLKRLPNMVIVLCCMAFVSVGLGLQYLAITRSFTFQRDELIRKSNEAYKTLKETQDLANHNGNDVQIELLKYRLLANEKKFK